MFRSWLLLSASIMSAPVIFVSLGACLLAYVVFNLAVRSKQYPPGPPSWPIFGVALNHPKTEFWKTYAEWGNKYGLPHSLQLINLGSMHIFRRRRFDFVPHPRTAHDHPQLCLRCVQSPQQAVRHLFRPSVCNYGWSTYAAREEHILHVNETLFSFLFHCLVLTAPIAPITTV